VTTAPAGERGPIAGGRDEQGITLIFVALLLTTLMAISGLAIDGGRLFTARRQAQDGADAAAIAGANALFAYQYYAYCTAVPSACAATPSNPGTASVNTAVLNLLSSNSVATSPACQLTDDTGAVLEPCAGATDAQLQAASGVQASGAITQSASLMQVVGINSYAAPATATAAIQPLVSTGAPFILCGASDNGYDILNAFDQITSNAMNLQNIPLQSANPPACGAPTSKFDGQGYWNNSVSAGSWESVVPGNGSSTTTANQVAGLVPCPSDPTQIPSTGCGMIVPVASRANTDPSNPQLLIVTFAIFNVVPTNGDAGAKYLGTYVPPSVEAVGGAGAFGVHCTSGVQVCTTVLVK